MYKEEIQRVDGELPFNGFFLKNISYIVVYKNNIQQWIKKSKKGGEDE